MEDSSVRTNQELYDKIYDGITTNKENILILICAVVIASIGLNMNSQPVVIGAMLISPIMGPVQGIGMGLATFDSRLTAKAIKLLLLEAGFAIVAAAIYFLVSPITYPSAEILSRTQPTIWDAIIALFGGIAGMIGARKKEANNIVPGVAIATTLMPPLCVMGYGIYERDLSFLLGAGYLFLVNVSCIVLSSFLVLQVLRISTRKIVKQEEAKKRNYVMTGIAVLVLVPSIFSAASLVKKQIEEQQVKKFVANEFTNYYVLNQTLDNTNRELVIDTIGTELSKTQLDELQEKMSDYQLADYTLAVKQVADSSSLSLKDLDRYLEERGQEDDSLKETQRVNRTPKDGSLRQEMEKIKQQLFQSFPNKISTITLSEKETSTGELNGVIDVAVSEKISAKDKEAIKEKANSYIEKQERKIFISIQE